MSEFDLYSGREYIRSLARLGYDFHTVSQEAQFRESYDYRKNYIALGIDELGEPVYINLYKAGHILIVGMTGDGKSWLTRGIFNRFFNAKGNVAIPTDTKPEYFSSSNPLQPHFRKFLLPKEIPRGYPVRTYRPYFISKLSSVAPRRNETPCQISLQDIELSDLYTLMNVYELTDAKRVAVEEAFRKVKDGDINSIEEMCDDIEANEDIGGATKKSLSGVLKNLERMGVIGDRFDRMDFVGDIVDGRIPAMNLKGGLGTGKFDHYANAYIALTMRQLLDAKGTGRLPGKEHLLILLDELNRYCSATGESVAKEEILRALDIFRQERGMLCFSTQDVKRIPGTVLEQCKYVLVGPGANPETLKFIIKRKCPGEVDYPVVFDQDVSFLAGSMKVHRDGSRDWLFIDSASKSKPTVFRPVAPLSAHREEGS